MTTRWRAAPLSIDEHKTLFSLCSIARSLPHMLPVVTHDIISIPDYSSSSYPLTLLLSGAFFNVSLMQTGITSTSTPPLP